MLGDDIRLVTETYEWAPMLPATVFSEQMETQAHARTHARVGTELTAASDTFFLWDAT